MLAIRFFDKRFFLGCLFYLYFNVTEMKYMIFVLYRSHEVFFIVKLIRLRLEKVFLERLQLYGTE